MKLDRNFFMSSTGQVLLVGAVLFIGVLAVRWQHSTKDAPPLPMVKPAPAVPLPKTMTREVMKFMKPPAPSSVPAGVTKLVTPADGAATMIASTVRELPLALYSSAPIPAPRMASPSAPFGRLIPCETIVALESNRIETPIIGLVTEDVWHDGRLVIPAGAEVHGRAGLDRERERIAAHSAWRIVWRTPDADNGTELSVDGLALDREFDGASGRWGEHDGSAGLRGHIVRTENDRELKLFAATFLAAATTALQDTRATAGLLGETTLPATTVRNATLAGTSAVLREYAQAMREAIARDGFYLRVPAGKPFYLYVTQTIDRSQARRGPSLATATPSRL